MKLLLLSLTLLFSLSAHADRHSDALQTCAKFRRSSIAQQRRDARPYTREQVFAACREILNPATQPGRSAPWRPPVRGCSGSNQCHPSQHCINRECVDRYRATCNDRGRDQCPAGEKCVNGVCK